MKKLVLIGLLAVNNFVLADVNTGLVAYYPFNGDANDASGNGNHGTIHGGISLTQDKLGNENNAYYFDGVDGYISVQNSITLNPKKQITIALWLRADSNISGYSPLIDKGGTGSSGCTDSATYSIFLESSFFFQLNDTGGCSTGFDSPKTKITKGKWYFFVGIIDLVKSQKSVYIDGILKAKSTYNNLSLIPSSGEMRIGWTTEINPAYSYFNGVIDEIRIYNRSLTSSEITELYNFGVSVNGTIQSLATHTVSCKNETTGQIVNIPATQISSFDCELKGLKAGIGDNISILIKGKNQ